MLLEVLLSSWFEQAVEPSVVGEVLISALCAFVIAESNDNVMANNVVFIFCSGDVCFGL